MNLIWVNCFTSLNLHAVSAGICLVNPFDQPGVESYKSNMFALLGKPGYEEKRKELMQRLKG